MYIGKTRSGNRYIKSEGKAGFNQNSPLGLWPAAGYDDKHVIAMCNFGSYASLGEMNLRQIRSHLWLHMQKAKMWIMPAIIQRLALQTKGAMQTAGGEKVSDEDAGVITKYVFEGSVPGGWQGRVDVTLELNSDYNGEVFCSKLSGSAFPHGFVITDIRICCKAKSRNIRHGYDSSGCTTLTGFCTL